MKGQRLLIQQSIRPKAEEWMGLFIARDSMLPEIVLQGRDLPQGELHSRAHHLSLAAYHTFYKVME
jgi:hypothetical protein